ncbi:metal-dependent hydrolase [Natronolimnobius baerhuensis]|uniref:Metal-dependent hydrolase n=1 Tax=Natronolimnobius baerhuensis TaxID=253108 RepID=A0A202EAB5_9EURY|nr:metal-dependent hydrolase [Natronolimnobius baerhuensis]OVE85159.1 metal-dependent hydrolase [Natronolimnobius baerhuensis]
MADLLTHVLVGYCLGTALSIRVTWIRPAHVTMVMVGAALPDLAKIELVVSWRTMVSRFGVPWDWFALHTLGGTVVTVLLVSLLLEPKERWRVACLLAVGVASHHVFDVILLSRTGLSYPVFWPLTTYQPPAGGLFYSWDRWPAAVTGIAAFCLWRYRLRRENSPSPV